MFVAAKVRYAFDPPLFIPCQRAIGFERRVVENDNPPPTFAAAATPDTVSCVSQLVRDPVTVVGVFDPVVRL
jgi:hypothetical protein